MSQRSGLSAVSQGSNQPVDLSEVYQYVLRVAYLSYLATARAVPSASQGRDDAAGAGRATPAKPARPQSKAADGWTGALFSIGDIFKESKDAKSVQFPKELVKVLQKRIEAIARGADPNYSDILLRSTFGVFYGTYTQESFQKQLKSNRKIEELILLFVTAATGVLKKRLEGDEWKMNLNSQVSSFVKIIRECLQTKEVGKVPPELQSRLAMYSAKLVPPKSSGSSVAGSSAHGDGSRAESTSPVPPTSASESSPWTISHSVGDMPLVIEVGQLFGVPEGDLQKDVNYIRKFCTEKAAVEDLKACIANVSTGARFPGRREDFRSEESYSRWRAGELQTSQQLMLTMIKFNPELVQSAPDDFVMVGKDRDPVAGPSGYGNKRQSGASLGVMAAHPDYLPDMLGDEFDHLSSSHSYTYIPPNPRGTYLRLLEHCLDFDLEVMKTLAEDEEVSLRILSQGHLDLLGECAVRWRVTPPYRVASFFDSISKRFAGEEIPIVECVGEALGEVSKVLKDTDLDYWTIRDRTFLGRTISSIFDTLLRRVYEITQAILEGRPTDELPSILETLYTLAEFPSFYEDVDHLSARFEELREAIFQLFDQTYQMKSTELFSSPRANDLVPFIVLLDWISATVKLLNKRFTEPLLGSIDFVALFIARVAPVLLQDLDAMRAILLPPPPDAGAEASSIHDRDILDLYRGVLDLKQKHDMCNPEDPLPVDLDGWFGAYVTAWLDSADAKTSEWVRSAIRADKFEPEGEDMHSSSITDLMDSCRSAVDFVQKLKWPDELQNAKYMTRLSRTISKSIEQYCYSIEDLFMSDMFPRSSTNDVDREATRSAIFKRARMAVQGEKKPESFQFKESSCVQLNNINAARVLLDQIYSSMDADNVSRIIHEYEPEAIQPAGLQSKYLFTVKVVTAEGLVGADGSASKLDPFLTLSDERGNRVAKTRTLYETAAPRWNETFDISVQGSLWLAATVWKRNLVDQHDMLGRAFLHLNPPLFSDFLAHDLLLDLDTQGRALLRVSMEGEKDDSQFYFGRAFRSLKRAETDMVRAIVDKISPVVRHYLSHSTIRKLIPSQGFMSNLDLRMPDMSKFDMSKLDIDVTKMKNSFFRSVGGGSAEPLIPLPREEIPEVQIPAVTQEAARQKGPRELTDAEVEAVIGDLFEYFDSCISVLRHSLSDSAWKIVMTKIWKDILNTIDGLLLPPLSDQPSAVRPLTDREVDVVFKWLRFLTNFFHAEGEGVPIEDLQSKEYRALWSIRLFYDMSTDNLMRECVRAMQAQMGGTSKPISRNKSVYQQRNLGTIKRRKTEKKKDQEPANCEMIMRILRMRPRTTEFLSTQLQALQSLAAQQAKQAKRPSGLSRRNPSATDTISRGRLNRTGSGR